MLPEPPLTRLRWRQHYRIIPSTYPPVNFFEGLVDPDQMDALWHIESLTNDRLRLEAGDISLVSPQDRICGPGSTPIMAAFTHIGRPSRFTDGSFGVYYASKTMSTAIHETVFQKELFLSATRQNACDVDMRVYIGRVVQPLHDLRDEMYGELHHPSEYTHSQAFARLHRDKASWGFAYNSVRHPDGENIAIFRPPALTPPTQGEHLAYSWDGSRITAVYAKSAPLVTF